MTRARFLVVSLCGSARALTGVGLCLSLALAPVTGFAAPEPAPEAEAEPEPESGELDDARALFDAGVARYTAADYGAAITYWLDAYAMIPSDFENRLIKAEIIYNVARAQRKWFEIDQDVTHLRQASEVLAHYLVEIDSLYGDQGALEREKIEEQIEEVDTQIVMWEAEQARREAELAERLRPKFDEAADAREEKRNKSLIGAGAGLTALGVGGVGMLVSGIIVAGSADSKVGTLPLEADIAERESAIGRGYAGNALIVTGSLAGAVFLTAGIPLLVAGGLAEKKRKQRRTDAGLDRARVDTLAPSWVRGGVGLSLSGRF